MTKRQKMLGCTEYGVERAKKGEWLADFESFMAKMATVKKGQYIGFDLFSKKFGIDSHVKYEMDVQKFLVALDVNCNKHFVYTNTLGLDCLTVR